MKKITKTKVVIISLLTLAFFLTVVLLGASTLQNRAAQDSDASAQQRCIPYESAFTSHCTNVASTGSKPCSDPSYYVNISAKMNCCYFNTGTKTCGKYNFVDSRYANACQNITCSGQTDGQCRGGTESINLHVCKDNPNYKPSTSGGGTTTTPPVVTPGTDPSQPPVTGGSGPTTPSCTPVAPAVAKLVSPRSRTEIVESKVTLTWEKGGSFGKECSDNGKPNRFILKYAVVGKNQACPTIGTKYIGRQLVEKLPNQKQYSVELSALKNNKKYCWFIRTKNGETKSETKVRSFTTNIAAPVAETPEEALKVTEGGTSIDVVNNAE